ncbi:MAG: NAD(P)/FAD-dependent oxidoreductase, partial [Verrucomicrobia bacterium]|nr:NAD(P)/FAD-dependent oxidoreductase [Verrucomicrobiota bacterium]
DAGITVVDRQNHHLFQPLLYQVATAALTAPDIAQPTRHILRGHYNLTVLLDEVRDFDLTNRKVICANETLDYDFLVLAVGAVTSYFGHPEWEAHAPGLKTIDDAMAIRRRLLVAFERAETTTDLEEQRRLMTMVVIGGGPTGVELAGAFAEVATMVLVNDFRRIDPKSAKIILIEGSPHLLTAYPEDLRQSAKQQLEDFGVQVRLDTKVKDLRAGEVELASGEIIRAETIVWGAGVAANPLTKKLGLREDALDRAGRIKVNPDLTIPGHPEVFAIGDLVSLVDPKTRQPVPGVSPAAMQMGEYVAGIIADDVDARQINAGARSPFTYWDKGTMATIGRAKAVAMVGKFHFSGLMAWLAWLFIHLFFLVGFRNKIGVFFNWAYSYLTHTRSARVITGIRPYPAPAPAPPPKPA